MDHLTPHPPKCIRRHQLMGFTLIELIMVIVIMGTLAAVVLPKFINFGRDARIAALDSMRTAMDDALEFTFSKCVVTAGCGLVFYGNSPQARLILDGKNYLMSDGYIYADSVNSGLPSLGDRLNIRGFTQTGGPGSRTTTFELNGAPDPVNCRVTYDQYTLSQPTNPKVITIATTGC